MTLDNKDKKILKELINAGYKMLLHKYSEEELNRIVSELYKNINN